MRTVNALLNTVPTTENKENKQMTIREITEFLIATPTDDSLEVNVGISYGEEVEEVYSLSEIENIPDALLDREVTYYVLQENYIELFC